MAAVKEKKPIRIMGASLMGKYIVIRLHGEAFEVRSISTFIMIFGLWLIALAVMLPSMMTNNIWIGLAGLIVGGVAGFFVMTRVYPGKKEYLWDYKEITSFVYGQPDFTINLANTKMITLRMLPRKQQRLLEAMQTSLLQGGVYYLEKMGGYYKVRKYGQEPAED